MPNEPIEDPAVTRLVARSITSCRGEDVLPEVRHEARKAFLNWLGCAIGGSRHEAIDIAIRALAPFSSTSQASVLGRDERTGMFDAALFNGISSHVLDFDDTHLKSLVHPSGPVASAALAYAECRQVSVSGSL